MSEQTNADFLAECRRVHEQMTPGEWFCTPNQ